MIEKISRFRDQASFVLLDSRQSGLYRLLAKFLGAVSDAFIDQTAGVRFRRACPGTLTHPLFQIRQAKLAHDCLFGGSIALLRSGIETHWQACLGHVGLGLATAIPPAAYNTPAHPPA